jgi:outer membrane lipoprotein carrier protein
MIRPPPSSKSGVRTRLAAALVLLFAASPAAAAPPATATDCAEAVARRVQRYYDGVHDLSARFEQSTDSPGGAASGASGTVVFAKPGRMRWDYEKPLASLVVSDGTTLWIWDPELREAQKLTVTEGFLSGAAIQFLLGEGRLLESFDVRAESCSGDPLWLDLEPHEPATYQHLRLRVRRKTGEVVETGIVDLLGNHIRIAFTDVRVNQAPPAATFTFEPPKGARVIEVPAAPR